jgi:hypothetical protein
VLEGSVTSGHELEDYAKWLADQTPKSWFKFKRVPVTTGMSWVVEEVWVNFEECDCGPGPENDCKWEKVSEKRGPFFIDQNALNIEVPTAGYFSKEDADARAKKEISKLKEELGL